MAAINEKIVYRTWGLFEARVLSTTHNDTDVIRYGPKFQYDECLQSRSWLTGFMWTAMLMISEVMMSSIQPMRWLLKRFGPQPGTGPKP